MVLAVELGRERKRKERKEEACPAGGRTRLGENISIVLSRTVLVIFFASEIVAA